MINQLNRQTSTGYVAAEDSAEFDVTGDGRVSALDALLIVNELNSAAAALAPALAGGQTSEDRYASDVDALFAELADGQLV